MLMFFLGHALAAPTPLTDWVALPPVEVPYPLGSAEEGSLVTLLDGAHLPAEEPWPCVAQEVWEPCVREGAQEVTNLRLGRVSTPTLAAFVTTLDVRQYTSGTLELDTTTAARVWVDGTPVMTASEPTSKDPVTADLTLTTGAHRILVVTASDADARKWNTSVAFDAGDAPKPVVDAEPYRPVNLDDLLDRPAVTGLSISADGSWASIGWRSPGVAAAHVRYWTELHRVDDPETFIVLDGNLSQFRWSPTGDTFAATVSDGETQQLVVGTPEGGRRSIVELPKMGGLQWLPDGSGLIYSVNDDYEDDGDGIKRVRSTADRWPGQRDNAHLWHLDISTGQTRQLTALDESVTLHDILPVALPGQGFVLLLSQETYDTGTRPFTSSTFFELDLQTLTRREVMTSAFINGGTYGRKGVDILWRGSPMAFDGIGITTPEGVTPNDYDTQLFASDRDGQAAVARTRAFKGTVRSMQMATDDTLFLTAEVEDHVKLFKGDAFGETFDEIALKGDAVHQFAISADGGVLIAESSSANTPSVLTLLVGDKATRLPHYNDDLYSVIEPGVVDNFDVTLDNGDMLTGRVHLPPEYDPEGDYPAIIYYYGGTSPVSRKFGGRYPHAWWAAQGYVVYVPQPSGATGFGQAWSARHVRDWGDQSARDVLEGTEAFLKAYPAVDGERLGCIGASFGGFLTMKLITQSDRFAAAISHAGISLIPSYWGEGFWGYLYSSASAADAYPWSDPEVYLDRSPLLKADQITTPLLLLHGTGDTNVPVGESDQMYAALKVLGKEVEYLQVDGENHWIIAEEQRRIWAKSIVAWFDRHLKKQPDWWNDLVGDD